MWKKIEFAIVLLLLAVLIMMSNHLEEMVSSGRVTGRNPCIVLDSGHGGEDPGKIGVNQAKEKDVNLKIAKKTKERLEKKGWKVVMTREKDVMLGDPAAGNKKIHDMKARVERINKTMPQAAVSIHQNSFTEEKYRGAQVFYYGPSERSRGLAASIQQALIEFQDPDNTRQEKANEDYYLLRKETVPTVICECGFMSNAAEEALLKSEMYQEKTAWAISVGIVRYLNGSTEKGDIEHDR